MGDGVTRDYLLESNSSARVGHWAGVGGIPHKWMKSAKLCLMGSPETSLQKTRWRKYDRKYTFTHIELLVVNFAQGGKRTGINYL